MSDLVDFVGGLSSFYRNSAVDQLLMLAWFSEARRGKPCFDAAYMRQCFRDIGVDPPDLSVYLPRLAGKKPPQLVREKGGYRLSGAFRRALDAKLSEDPTIAAVSKVLTDLPAQIPNIAERDFLSEALNCYRVKAYRAAITMAWNLAYDHLVRWVFADAGRLAAMNSGIASRYPKKGLNLKSRDDADELKESEFIEAARTGGLVDKNTTQILKDKLIKRNMAAHPSRVIVTQHQADDTITDLVANVILRLG